MRAQRGVRLIAVVAVASMALAACSGGGAEPKERANLASLLGISGDVSTYNGDVQARREEREELTATCMQEAGWEYIPVHYPNLPMPTALSPEDELALIKSSGLGFAAQYLDDGTGASAINDPWEGFVDPNTEYVDSLSEDEKVAYEVSLSGTAEEQAQTMITTTQFDPATGSQMSFVRSQSGCQGEADIAVSTDEPSQTPEEVTAIKDYWAELQDRVKADPRSIALDERWSSCMYDAGYDYASREAFDSASYLVFSGKVRDVGVEYPPPDPFAGWSQDKIDDFFAAATDDEVDVVLNTKPDVTPDQRRELEGIFAQEVAVGLAKFECSQSLKDESAQIYADVEEQYALEHEHELAALAVAIASEK